MGEPRNIMESFANAVWNALNGPVTFFREKIVVPNQQHYPWYHQKFRRVPTIDECYIDDVVCGHEAHAQFKQDKLVDSKILLILRQRIEDCILYEGPDAPTRCQAIHNTYEEAAADWFTKYGDLGHYGHAKDAYMKQKHRMIWERRYGPVGTGMNPKKNDDQDDS